MAKVGPPGCTPYNREAFDAERTERIVADRHPYAERNPLMISLVLVNVPLRPLPIRAQLNPLVVNLTLEVVPVISPLTVLLALAFSFMSSRWRILIEGVRTRTESVRLLNTSPRPMFFRILTLKITARFPVYTSLILDSRALQNELGQILLHLMNPLLVTTPSNRLVAKKQHLILLSLRLCDVCDAVETENLRLPWRPSKRPMTASPFVFDGVEKTTIPPSTAHSVPPPYNPCKNSQPR